MNKVDKISFTYGAVTEPAQVPICMIGDSITWATYGDYWRKYLLERIPHLAFVGTHTATLGYSHAGEGGNSTRKILERIDDIPDCPYYSLLVGTNDSGVEPVAERIIEIVNGLLKKTGAKKVFLCSILPCSTEPESGKKDLQRDKDNSATNVILRDVVKTNFTNKEVEWIELEKPIREIPDWESKIRLHPLESGYKIIADIYAEKIVEIFNIKDPLSKPIPKQGVKTGVRVHNLWDDATNTTRDPVVAGWYTVSFALSDVVGVPSVKVSKICIDEENEILDDMTIDISLPQAGSQRGFINFFTGYEDYGYVRDKIRITPKSCKISEILFEKTRPSKMPSVYQKGIYIDTISPVSLGELIELYTE